MAAAKPQEITAENYRQEAIRNEAFRALALPAGERAVDMFYRRRSVLLGLATSAAAVGLGLLPLVRRAG